MNIRLHGTPEECAAAASVLPRTLGLTVQDISRPYRDRNSRLSASTSPSPSSRPPSPTALRLETAAGASEAAGDAPAS